MGLTRPAGGVDNEDFDSKPVDVYTDDAKREAPQLDVQELEQQPALLKEPEEETHKAPPDPGEETREAPSNPEEETQKAPSDTEKGAQGAPPDPVKETQEAPLDLEEKTKDEAGPAAESTDLGRPVVPARLKFTTSFNLPPDNVIAHMESTDAKILWIIMSFRWPVLWLPLFSYNSGSCYTLAC